MISSTDDDTNSHWYNTWKSKMDSGKSSPYPWLSFSVFRDGSYTVRPNTTTQRPATGSYRGQRLLGTTRSSSATGYRRRLREGKGKRSPTPDHQQQQQFGYLTSSLPSRTSGRATPLSNVQVSVSGGAGNTPTHTVIKTKYGRKIRVPGNRQTPQEQSILPPETPSTVSEIKAEKSRDQGFQVSTEKGRPKKPPTPTDAGDIKDVENLEDVDKLTQPKREETKNSAPSSAEVHAQDQRVSQITLPQTSVSMPSERLPSYGLPNSVAKSKPISIPESSQSENSKTGPAPLSMQSSVVITPSDVVPKTITIPVATTKEKPAQSENGHKPVFSFAHSTTTGNVTSLSYMGFLNKLQEKHNLGQTDQDPPQVVSNNVTNANGQKGASQLPTNTEYNKNQRTNSITAKNETADSRTLPTASVAVKPTTTTTTLPTFSSQSLSKANGSLVGQAHKDSSETGHKDNFNDTTTSEHSQKPLVSISDGSSTTEIYPIRSILKKGGNNVFKSNTQSEKLSPSTRPHTAGGTQRIGVLRKAESISNTDLPVRRTVRRTPSLMNGELSLRARSYSAGPKRGVRFDMANNSIYEYEPAPAAVPTSTNYVNDNEHWYRLMWKKLAEQE